MENRKVITTTFLILGILIFIAGLIRAVILKPSLNHFLIYIFVALICFLISIMAVKPEEEAKEVVGKYLLEISEEENA
jgi:hypothetical protein